ncbi:uncharacterized protein V6R79_018427 [Siganus canaliculatus]
MHLVNCPRSCAVTLLCFVLSGAGALNVDIPQPQYEYARGDNITLPCRFQPKVPLKASDIVIISWSAEAAKVDAKETQILAYYAPQGRLDIKSSYEGRVSLDVNVLQGKADLKLSSITLADNKVFECRLLIPGDDEGRPADTASLVVLVAPSPPICSIQGKEQYGQNINITCESEEGSPLPTYEWKSYNVQDIPRPLPPKTTSKDGILSLYNVSRETSGYYICTSKNKIRSATCNVTVTVMPPSMNIGSTAGIIAGAVAALIALVIIIYCCCCRKKKNDEEEYAMGVREEEYHDKEPARNGESRQADGQEDPRAYSDAERQNRYEDHNERDTDRRRDYDDRQSDYDDRRSDYNDRRSDYNDRRSNSENRQRDYDDRRNDYDDRQSDYDDRRSDYSNRRDRHERYDDDRRYDDERRYEEHHRDRQYDDDGRYDEPYDDRDRDRPPVPNNKPTRRDYDD